MRGICRAIRRPLVISTRDGRLSAGYKRFIRHCAGAAGCPGHRRTSGAGLDNRQPGPPLPASHGTGGDRRRYWPASASGPMGKGRPISLVGCGRCSVRIRIVCPPLDAEAALHARSLSRHAQTAGIAVGFADLTVAAIASAHGLIVATRNVRDFAPMQNPTPGPVRHLSRFFAGSSYCRTTSASTCFVSRSRRTSTNCQSSRIGTPTTISRARRTSDTPSDSSAGHRKSPRDRHSPPPARRH